jgi:hypothetical protein
MEITPGLGVAIMMNNYFHDVATALLLGSAVALYVISKVQESISEPVGTLFFLKSYRRLVRLFRFALYWIIIGGIPRTIFYTRFEWANAAGKGQVPALIVKHILMVILVVWGFIAWRRLKRKAAALRESLPAELQAQI